MNELIKSILPTIATAFGGPLAGIAAGVITKHLGIPESTVENVANIVSGMSPDKLVELKSVESELQLKLASLGYDSIAKIEDCNTRVLESINSTMRTEATSEKWPQYSWRPFIGFMFGSYIGSMWLLPLVNKIPTLLSPDLTLAVGAILGVASWYRGKKQTESV